MAPYNKYIKIVSTAQILVGKEQEHVFITIESPKLDVKTYNKNKISL